MNDFVILSTKEPQYLFLSKILKKENLIIIIYSRKKKIN